MKHLKIFENNSDLYQRVKDIYLSMNGESRSIITRTPNTEECIQLSEYLVTDKYDIEYITDEDIEDCIDQAQESYSVIIENYISDSPGYRGKILFTVWGGGAEYFEVFTFTSYGKLEKIKSSILH